MLKACFLSIFLAIAGEAYGPSAEMFDELLNAPTAPEAAEIESDIFAAWMESGSPTVDILMERAAAAQILGDFDFARDMYDRAILIQPGYAEAWNRRAVLFLVEEKYDEALRDVNEALRLEPRHFAAWAGLGSVLETLGAQSQALEAYREALKIHPHYAPALQAEKRLAPLVDGRGL